MPLTLLLFIQATVHPFVTLKAFGFHTLIELLFAGWVLLVLLFPVYRPKPSVLLYTLSGYIGILLLASIFGYHFPRSFWSTPDRAIGVYSLLHFFAYFLMLTSLIRPEAWRRYLVWLFWVSSGVAFLAIVERLTPQLFLVEGSIRLSSTLGNPSFLAAYLLFNVFIGLWLLATAKAHNWGRGMLISMAVLEALQMYILVLTNTRGALIGFGVGCMIILAFFGTRRLRSVQPFTFSRSIVKNIPLLICIVAILFGSVFLLTIQAPVWQKIPGLDRLAQISTGDNSVSHRLIAWKIAWQSFLDKPLLGWGFENFRYAFDQRYNPILFRTGFAETYWDKPHNIVLEVLVTSGLVGFLAYVGVFAVAFWFILRRAPKDFIPFGFALFAAYLIQNLFLFDGFGSYLMWFAVLAYLSSLPKEAETNTALALASKKNLSRPIALILSGVVALVMIWTVVLNSKIIYANNREYWGLNYFVNKLPVEAVVSFTKAMAVSEPYQDDIRYNYLSALQQVVSQTVIPNPEQAISQALNEFEEIVKNDPNFYFYRTLRGEARLVFYKTNQKFLEGAEDDLEAALRLSPNRQQNYYFGSKLKYTRGDTPGALAMMRQAIDLDPQSAEPHFYYGLLLLQAGDRTNGFFELEKGISMGRDVRTGPEERLIATFYADAERYEEAWYYYSRAAGSFPDDLETALRYALVSYYTGRLGVAQQQLGKIAKAIPNLRTSPEYAHLKPLFEAIGLR